MRDLEIYIRDIELAAVGQWLRCHIEHLELPDTCGAGKAVKGRGSYTGRSVRISIYPGAGGKRYASLILEGEELPWETDLDCGRSAWRALELEVRCSPGDWKEGEPVQDEKWWRIDQRGEQLAVWN